jgi:hypothetical protein
MATQEMSPMSRAGNFPPQIGKESRERSPKYKIPLKDGTVLIAFDDQDLIEKMRDYRANAN